MELPPSSLVVIAGLELVVGCILVGGQGGSGSPASLALLLCATVTEVQFDHLSSGPIVLELCHDWEVFRSLEGKRKHGDQT